MARSNEDDNDPRHFRHRIAFAQRSAVSDGYGNEEGAWAELFELPARLIPRLGGESVMSARLEGTQPVTLRVRVSTESRQITPDWRARDVVSGVIYNVQAIADPYAGDARHDKWYDLLCVAGRAV